MLNSRDLLLLAIGFLSGVIWFRLVALPSWRTSDQQDARHENP